MKNEVRPIDTNALNNEVMNRPFVRDIKKVSECTCDKKCDHNATNMRLICGKPLTLEQLREMDGQPVWVERNEAPHDGKWFIVDHADVENPDKTLYTKEGVTYSDYGTYFTAYAYPPAHIDREAWEPCEECEKKSCDDCRYSEYLSYLEPCKSCENASEWKPMQNFCGECSRPLTEEAWAELEKRLRG